MKYIILQPDGVADWPIAELGDRTPLEYGHTPNMDYLACYGMLGMTHTIPEGCPPGSDVGTMSILGYDPRRYHTGRSPIEAASMGVELRPDDVAFRCNLVCIEGGAMCDFTAGHISTDEAAKIIRDLQRELGGDGFEFYPGVSYRHLLVWRGGKVSMGTTPPHDITDRPVAGYLPDGDGADVLRRLMAASQEILAQHAVNRARRERGQRPATSIWLWGQGKRPALPTLRDRFGINGSVISAVDLVNGLGVLAGLEVIRVPGVTGFLDTNYQGKAAYALRALAAKDLVFVHVEATDETGHMGDVQKKIQAVEDFDSKVLAPILEGLREIPEWRLLMMPDHATPCALKTHSADPVPFVLVDAQDLKRQGDRRAYGERAAAATGVVVAEAHTLLPDYLVKT
ncbi:MAG: putative homoserine kinase [Deltaproteobacteria bacterium]|nr:putative homoserine kinase [Deltaproteobacteria bacterium]